MRSLGCIAAAWLLAAAGAGAEESGEEGARRRLAASLAEPALTSALAGTNPQLVLQGTTGDRTATARFGLQVGSALFDVKLAGPVTDARATRLADLDGLRGSTSADLGLGWVFWDPVADPVVQQRICDEYRRSHPEAAPGFVCAATSLPRGSPERRQFDRAVAWGTPLVVRGRYRVGQRTYRFVDPGTLASASETHTNYSLSAAAGVLTHRLGLVAVAYRYEESFDTGEGATLCAPFGATPALRCEEVDLGPPARRHANVLVAEVRRFVGESLGLNPRLSYDATHEVWGLELPVYFLQDPELGLNGGLSLGWRSDDEVWLLSVFVGAALGVLP
jgi:hypothetical protein